MKMLLVETLAVTLLAAVAVAQEEATKTDMLKIQGTWRLLSREKDGKADAAEAIKDIVMINKGDKFSFKGSASGAGAMTGTFTLDATKKPKTMDRIPADGPRKGKTLPGIYALDGDTLKICVSLTGAERPSEFATRPNSGVLLSVFKREK
jgi:uncharacterized protein (TIGR03067 family)